MVSQEFKSVIANKNLLRTRIMLKDSFVVDPTLSQLKEMLEYAKERIPDLCIPFDGDILEDDSNKWNQEVMNMELVQLVNNFSEERIAHLKRVVPKVMDAKIQKAKEQRCQTQLPNQQSRKDQDSTTSLGRTPEECKKNAVQQIMNAGAKINNVLDELKRTENWREDQMKALETAAEKLLDSIQKYKRNR